MNDLINAGFEFGAALFMLGNIQALVVHKTVRGVYIPATAFFSLWGLWNLHYYPSLGQWLSFTAGMLIVAANIVWCALASYYARRDDQ